MSVRTHYRLGHSFMDLLGTISKGAEFSSKGMFSNAQFVTNALYKLRVALCVWNARLEWAVAGFFTWDVSSCFMQDLLLPCVDCAGADG
jgi:hypothetical protein